MRNFANGVVRTWVVLAFAITSIASSEEALAQEGQKTFSELAEPQTPAAGMRVQIDVPNLRSQMRRAVVFAGSDDWLFRRQMSEADLPSISCTYEFNDAASIDSLLDLLGQARIENDPTPGLDVNVRIGVYLYTDNGQQAALILSRPRKYEDGQSLARGTYNGAALAATGQFYHDVQNLLARMQPTKLSFYCNRYPHQSQR